MPRKIESMRDIDWLANTIYSSYRIESRGVAGERTYDLLKKCPDHVLSIYIRLKSIHVVCAGRMKRIFRMATRCNIV
jgi:hypothetical protein